MSEINLTRVLTDTLHDLASVTSCYQRLVAEGASQDRILPILQDLASRAEFLGIVARRVIEKAEDSM